VIETAETVADWLLGPVLALLFGMPWIARLPLLAPFTGAADLDEEESSSEIAEAWPATLVPAPAAGSADGKAA
jgi:hypothetical protein